MKKLDRALAVFGLVRTASVLAGIDAATRGHDAMKVALHQSIFGRKAPHFVRSDA